MSRTGPFSLAAIWLSVQRPQGGDSGRKYDGLVAGARPCMLVCIESLIISSSLLWLLLTVYYTYTHAFHLIVREHSWQLTQHGSLYNKTSAYVLIVLFEESFRTFVPGERSCNKPGAPVAVTSLVLP